MNQTTEIATAEPTYQRRTNIHRSWQAANYLGAAQLNLPDNVLLERPLKATDIKPRLLGHWGTQPGLNMIYAHLNRLSQDTEANVLLVEAGHRGGLVPMRSPVYVQRAGRGLMGRLTGEGPASTDVGGGSDGGLDWFVIRLGFRQRLQR